MDDVGKIRNSHLIELFFFLSCFKRNEFLPSFMVYDEVLPFLMLEIIRIIEYMDLHLSVDWNRSG